ncbi:SNF2 family N-terminal domain-containing protein [Dactylonectria macrodidyma]|uniref:SNF2 family N-terminal domain-containing protein n=1 Tax=Dactylonectria macrodidyma TaxID=307937 RepID=A0A9P9JMC0_9HYPO|nr:SNF2 family N-terminal domain-containing protein [Dactylonectria macrodidyma]
MSPKKRPRQEAEREGPAKRSQHSHHGNQQTTKEIANGKNEDAYGRVEYCDLEDSDESMEEAPPSSETICYGALFDAKIKSCFIDRPASSVLPWSRFQFFPVAMRENRYFLINTAGGIENNFAELDAITASYLQAVKRFQDTSLTAVIHSASMDKIPGKRTKKATIIDATINILGPGGLAEAVGDALADTSAYLQHPLFLEEGVQYLNPHYFYFDGRMTDLRHLIGPRQEDSRCSRISQGIESALESSGNDASITISGKHDVDHIVESLLADTHLKSHQTKGVQFILSREDPGFCHKMNCDIVNLMDKSLLPHLSPCLGGVLADAMGLGKTLTMLSAIACYKSIANEPINPNACGLTTSEFTNSTLVVLPSKQVLDVWDSEIKRHFQPHILEVGNFYGLGRAKTTEALTKYDIVLTTYHTLAADWKGRRVLQTIKWLRVTLDEAHCIRNENTEVFKAAESLFAERRWCLTGTPIQNSMHDFRSLMKFLHHAPLMSSKLFEKHIMDPIRNGSEDQNQFRNLRLLLHTICLRRSEVCLNLPPSVTESVSVVQTEQESAEYQRILENCQKEFDMQVCSNQKQNKSLILFSTIMKLRRLCNHGTLPQGAPSQKPLISLKRRPKPKAVLQTVGNEFCDFCYITEGNMETFDGIDGCPMCGTLFNSSASPAQDCEMQLPFQDSSAFIPLSRTSTASPISNTASMAETVGHSSKLAAVVQNLEISCSNFNSKSVVFSSWRLTLDTLDKMLLERGITSLKIDGRVKPADRTAILSKFREDPGASVLLMTIDSGAVGLTLTNANRVHLIEPHWNPAMEAQAIARVLRMGQKQTVTIVKYITEKTVEQNIVKLQEKKSRIAKISLDRTSDVDARGLLDDLKFVLDTT